MGSLPRQLDGRPGDPESVDEAVVVVAEPLVEPVEGDQEADGDEEGMVVPTSIPPTSLRSLRLALDPVASRVSHNIMMHFAQYPFDCSYLIRPPILRSVWSSRAATASPFFHLHHQQPARNLGFCEPSNAQDERRRDTIESDTSQTRPAR